MQIIQSVFGLSSQALNGTQTINPPPLGRRWCLRTPGKYQRRKSHLKLQIEACKTVMISCQTSWLRRWTRREGGQGDSPAKILKNTPTPFLLLLTTWEELPLAKQRQSTKVQTVRQGIELIIKHAFRSCFLRVIKKGHEPQLWFSPIWSRIKSTNPTEARILPSLPPSRTLSRKLKLRDNVITKTEVTRQMPMWSVRRLHHLPLFPLSSEKEEKRYNLPEQEK